VPRGKGDTRGGECLAPLAGPSKSLSTVARGIADGEGGKAALRGTSGIVNAVSSGSLGCREAKVGGISNVNLIPPTSSASAGSSSSRTTLRAQGRTGGRRRRGGVFRTGEQSHCVMRMRKRAMKFSPLITDLRLAHWHWKICPNSASHLVRSVASSPSRTPSLTSHTAHARRATLA